MKLNFIDGYKSYLGAAIGLCSGLGQLLGYLDPETAGTLYVIASAVFGAGIAGKAEKLANAFRDAAKPAAMMMLAVGASFLFVSSPASAADCNFEEGVNAKVVRFGWPPAMGVNVGIVDVEVGASNYGMNLCGNTSVDTLALVCMIPKVGPLLGPLCSTATEGSE
jgi:hypothetical protein